MLRRIVLAVALGITPAAALFVAGCAGDNARKPYGLTGSASNDEVARKERLRWTDDKGHYRPDLRARGGPPLRSLP